MEVFLSYCEVFNRIVWKQTQPGVIVVVRIGCGSWRCPVCSKVNRQRWQKHLLKMLPKIGSNWWFITLTAHSKKRSAENSLENLRSNLDKLFKRMRRVWSNVEYVRVYEVHQKGAFHAHLLVSGLSARVQKFTTPAGVHYYRPTLLGHGVGNWQVRTWFVRQAQSLEMGYMVDVQAVQGTRAAVNYVIKYLTKEAQAFYVRGLRQVQTSRGIGGPRTGGSGDWNSAERLFRGEVPQGARVYDASRKLWIPEQYWSENLTYPKPE